MRDLVVLLLLLLTLAGQSAAALWTRLRQPSAEGVAPRAQAAAYFGLLTQQPAPDVAPHWTPEGDVPLPDVARRVPLASASPPREPYCPRGGCPLAPRPSAPAAAQDAPAAAPSPTCCPAPARRGPPLRQFARRLFRPRR